MKKFSIFLVIILSLLGGHLMYSQTDSLKIVLIRHGEKPKKGDNLSCKGENRANALVSVLYNKIGIPDEIFVPKLTTDSVTKHSRMFQTISPFAEKYNLEINSRYKVKDTQSLANYLLTKKRGTYLVVWEHKLLMTLARELGVASPPKWPGIDYDTMWFISPNATGKMILTIENEGINPSDTCPN